ncbi:MAG: YggT family protein [Clostridia bacterium]|nr:YggT family protein [Clostridia bacterium]
MLSILIELLKWLISIYATFMLVYCLLTWFIRDRSNSFMRVLAGIAEPPLLPIRNFLNRFYYFQNSPVDFSPLILFFFLRIIISLLTWLSRYF